MNIFNKTLIIILFVQASFGQNKQIILSPTPQFVPEDKIWKIAAGQEFLCELSYYHSYDNTSLCAASLNSNILAGITTGVRPKMKVKKLKLKSWTKEPFTNDYTYKMILSEDLILLPGEKVFLTFCLNHVSVTEIALSKKEQEYYTGLKISDDIKTANELEQEHIAKLEKEQAELVAKKKYAKSHYFTKTDIRKKSVDFTGPSINDIISPSLFKLAQETDLKNLYVVGDLTIYCDTLGNVTKYSAEIPERNKSTKNLFDKIDFDKIKNRKYEKAYYDGFLVRYYEKISIDLQYIYLKEYKYKVKDAKLLPASNEIDLNHPQTINKLKQLADTLKEDGTYLVTVLEQKPGTHLSILQIKKK